MSCYTGLIVLVAVLSAVGGFPAAEAAPNTTATGTDVSKFKLRAPRSVAAVDGPASAKKKKSFCDSISKSIYAELVPSCQTPNIYFYGPPVNTIEFLNVPNPTYCLDALIQLTFKACGAKSKNSATYLYGSGYYYQGDCSAYNYVELTFTSDKVYYCAIDRIYQFIYCPKSQNGLYTYWNYHDYYDYQ